MNERLTVSVVIVSRKRPLALMRCLTAVSQLQFTPFEIVVVADPAGLQAAGGLPFAEALKLVAFDAANISAARNRGVEHAAGDIIAFIDDDAVPEPLWLHHLTAPAARADVAAMGGFVRGRNGIGFQYRAQRVDAQGMSHPLEVDAEQATVLRPAPGSAIKTEGTNMAFRREILIALGGFDTAFRYFLDETDLDLRLARAGHATAIVPLAQVHHGAAANSVRRGDRVPRDLFEIAASWAVFQRKHLAQADHAGHWRRLRRSERHRLLEHVMAGRLEPRDVRRKMQRFDDGYIHGRSRAFGCAPMAAHPASPFRPFPSRPGTCVLYATDIWRVGSARAKAAQAVQRGEIVTLLVLSRTALYHRVRFTPEGFWEQRGGLFGKVERTDRLFSIQSVRQKMAKERARIRLVRGPTA